MLMEKAFAKLAGSYGALDGGMAVMALRCLLGDDSHGSVSFNHGARWQWMQCTHEDVPPGASWPEYKKIMCTNRYSPSDVSTDRSALWRLLRALELGHTVVVAGTRGSVDEGRTGLVPGHAYCSACSIRPAAVHAVEWRVPSLLPPSSVGPVTCVRVCVCACVRVCVCTCEWTCWQVHTARRGRSSRPSVRRAAQPVGQLD